MMAVLHRCWIFEIAQASLAFANMRGLSDLLKPEVARASARLREDPEREEHLVMARLDARDEEEWAAILNPTPDDCGFFRSGAARMMLLLIAACRPGKHLRVSPSVVEHVLAAMGWERSRIELAVRGLPLRTFFEAHTPPLRGVAADLRYWLSGGWLDGGTASDLRADLTQSAAAHGVTATASHLGRMAGDKETESTESRHAIAQLDAMLAQVEPGQGLWIIQD